MLPENSLPDGDHSITLSEKGDRFIMAGPVLVGARWKCSHIRPWPGGEGRHRAPGCYASKRQGYAFRLSRPGGGRWIDLPHLLLPTESLPVVPGIF